MKSHTILLGSAALAGILVIAGCHSSGGNKLLTANKNKAASFIYQAEKYASQKTRLYDSMGSAYTACIENPAHFNNPFKKTGENGCKKYFKAMVAYAKTTKAFAFTTVSDLEDKAVLARLSNEIFAYQSTGGQGNEVKSVEASLAKPK